MDLVSCLMVHPWVLGSACGDRVSCERLFVDPYHRHRLMVVLLRQRLQILGGFSLAIPAYSFGCTLALLGGFSLASHRYFLGYVAKVEPVVMTRLV